MNNILEMAGGTFLGKISMISWKAAQWTQYTGYEFNKSTDRITLKFRTSSYGISFEITMKAFSSLYGEPIIIYDEAYKFFKSLKYNKADRL